VDGDCVTKRPGTMLYFDIRPCLKRLSREEKGVLFEAILDYAEYGMLPEVDGVLGIAWDFIQPRLDRDRERYETISEKRTAAINARWEREREIQKNTNEYRSIQTIPTTTSPSTATTTSPPTATSSGARNLDFEFNERRRARLASLDGLKDE